MQLETILQQSKPYHHSYGDIIYGGYSPWMREFNKKDLAEGKILLLSSFSRNPWKAFDKMSGVSTIDLNKLLKSSLYTCPITDRKYSAILPIAIVAKDVKKYFNGTNSDLRLAAQIEDTQDWAEDVVERYLNEALDNVSVALMGPGYTMGCLPSDGGNSHVAVFFDFTNGDKLLCLTWVWHNK